MNSLIKKKKIFACVETIFINKKKKNYLIINEHAFKYFIFRPNISFCMKILSFWGGSICQRLTHNNDSKNITLIWVMCVWGGELIGEWILASFLPLLYIMNHYA